MRSNRAAWNLLRRWLWWIGPTELGLTAVAAHGSLLNTGASATVTRAAVMLLLGWIAAKGFSRSVLRGPGDELRGLATLLLGFFLIVWSQLALSALGLLVASAQWCVWWSLALSGILAGAGAEDARKRDEPERTPWARTRAELFVPLMGAACILPSVSFLARLWLAPPVEWDAWSYHLYFPVQWLQQGRIDYVAKPFGPEFITYFPCNVECWIAWLYSPTMSEWLPKTAGALFFYWTALALWQWSRLLGGPGVAALLPSAAWLLTPMLERSGLGTGNDCAGAAFFLTSLIFAEQARRTPNALLVGLSGVAAGLLVGTKFPNLLFAPLLASYVIAAIVGRAHNASADQSAAHGLALFGVWIGGAFAAGGYWHLRNWLQTGNPIYPGGISLLGIPIFNGPITRRQMYDGGWTHPDGSLAGLWTVLDKYFAGAASPWGVVPLLIVFAGFGVVASLALACRPSEWRLARWASLLLPVAGTLLFWWFIPYTSQPRYALPTLAVMYSWFALLPSTSGRARFAATAVGVLIVGLLFVMNMHLVIGGAGGNDVARQFVIGAGLVGVLFVVLVKSDFFPWPFGALGFGLGVFVILRFFLPAGSVDELLDAGKQRERTFARINTTNPWQLDVQQGWMEVQRRTRRTPATIAYAGSNHPYMLFGPQLKNRVVYVAPNAHDDWQIHQFAKHVGAEKTQAAVVRDRLPIYRIELNRDDWLANLRRNHVDFLFLTSVHPGERHAFTAEMDSDSYSIERRWADEAGFPLIASGLDFRLYRTAEQ